MSPDPDSERRAQAREQHQLGNRLIDEGKLDRAITAFRRALRADDSLAEVHNDLGAAYFQKRWFAEAEACFRKAIERDPEHGVAHANRGAALRALGRLAESRRAYQRALWLRLRALLPGFLRPSRRAAAAAPPAPAAPGEAQLQPVREAIMGGRAAQAAALAAELLARYPQDPDALHLSANALEENRDFEGALRLLRQALAQRPDRSDYHVSLARLHLRSGRLGEALNAATAALRLEPGSAEIHATIAGLLHPWRNDLAEEAARHSIELDARCDTGHANLAAVLWDLGRLEEAEREAREAVRLAPGVLTYRTNLALILKDLDRLDEARALYRALMADAPGHGRVCQDVGKLALEVDADLATARAMYRRAQATPDGERSALAEALLDLLESDFAAAWPKYEARKTLLDQRGHHERFAALPDWSGEPVRDGAVLCYAEQGLGDEVMFASMVPDLARRAGRVVLLCDPRLAVLFQRSFPGVEVLGEPRATQGERAAAHPGLRAKVAAGSLGGYFRRRREDFPSEGGYLAADPAKVQAWRARLAAGKLNVGLSWIGGVPRTGRGRRSIPLRELAPLLALPGTHWVSLQYTDAREEIAAAGAPLAAFPGVTDDLDELAALIGALDLVVSVCNSTVHLAGALGKDVLVMAPFVPEWRYGFSGERMAWYPSARVLRQARYGDWGEVLAAVASRVSARSS